MFEITSIAKEKLLALMKEENFNENCFVRIGVGLFVIGELL